MLVSGKSNKIIQSLAQRPTGHAYLLASNDREVLSHAAQTVTAGWMKIDVAKVKEHPYVKIVLPDEKGIISIDEVRKLTAFCRLKVLSSNDVQRVIIINEASVLTGEAQNSLLKLLEEPPAGTMIVLTTIDASALMPTVRSRAQRVELPQPTQQEIVDYFMANNYSEKDIKRAFNLQGSNIKAIEQYLEHASELDAPLAAAMRLLGASKYERLCGVDALSKNKPEALAIVAGLATLSSSALEATASDATKLAKWHNILRSCTTAQDALQKNANAKLVLTELFLKF
jgi:DNA polymerase III delta prime subunit